MKKYSILIQFKTVKEDFELKSYVNLFCNTFL